MFLQKTFGHQTRFEPLDCPILGFLDPKNLSISDCLAPFGQRYKLPGRILAKGSYFRIACLVPLTASLDSIADLNVLGKSPTESTT